LSKKEGFSLKKNALIGHRSTSLQSVCAKIKSSWTIAVESRSVQKLNSSAITLLQIFDLFFAGSRVATVYVTYVSYLLRTSFIHNSIATLISTKPASYMLSHKLCAYTNY